MKGSRLTIYPTARKVADQLMRLSRRGCVLGYRITTLPQVVDALWLEAADRRGSLSQAGERLVLSEAVARARLSGSLGPLTAGMSERMLSLLRRLKSAGLNPDDWRSAVETLPIPVRARLASFTPIFAAYQALLERRGLTDRHDRESAALALLHRLEAAGGRPQLLDGVAQFLVAEIYDLSLLQFMTVAALIRLVGDAELTIQATPHKVTASRFADLTWNRFVGEESIADQVLPAFVRRDGRAGQLGFVLGQLFTDAAPAPPPSDGTVRVIEAANVRGEAEAAARTIRRMLERDGERIPLNRIAIVARDLSPYGDHLEAAFRRHGLPLIREDGPALRGTMPARAVLEVLETVLDGLPREGLIALCDNAFMRVAARRYRAIPRETGYLDRETRPLPECIEQRKQTLRAAYEAAAAERVRIASQLATLEQAASVWVELLEALGALEAPASVPDHVDRLVALLGWLGFDPAAGSLVDSAARASGPLWRALEDLAFEATRVMPDRVVTLREFADLLESALRDVRLEPASVHGGDAVRAIPILEARGLDFDLVFILGLNDEVFPRYYPDDPLVPDELIRPLDRVLRARLKERLGAAMPDAPGPLLRSRGDRNSEEPFLFFLAMSMPARAIVLSCAVEDDGGRPLRRSPFLEEVLRRIGGEDRVEAIGRGDYPPWEDCFAERDLLNRAAHQGLLGSLPAEGSLAPARLESIIRRIGIEKRRAEYLARPTREALFEDRSRAQKGSKKDSPRNSMDWLDPAARAADPQKLLRATEYDGRIASNARLAQALLETPAGAPRPWSAKQLSEMAVCGFNFFARRILRLRDADELEHEPTRLETGDVVHHILRDFFDARPDFANPEAAFALAAEVAERWRLSAAAGARDPAFFELAWMAVREMIREVVAYESGRRAEGHVPDELEHEYRLEFPLELGPVTGAGPEQIPLVGSIDRLELYRASHGDRERGGAGALARIRVVDYKTSRSLDHLAGLLTPARFATTDLQMPVYMLGVIAQLRARLTPGVGVEASYIALQRREKETVPLVVPRELLDPRALEVATVAGRVRELVRDAADGHFDVDPLECSDWCPYRPVCRFEKTAGS